MIGAAERRPELAPARVEEPLQLDEQVVEVRPQGFQPHGTALQLLALTMPFIGGKLIMARAKPAALGRSGQHVHADVRFDHGLILILPPTMLLPEIAVPVVPGPLPGGAKSPPG
jgi:hypothetical protein